ncbi:MAG: tyrosine-type recombinase/integrase [Candidatus Moranbacteria bacterium]|nr:tyrosine-type recombinase/integrase [Candidatus Moranbacteria bacterium]
MSDLIDGFMEYLQYELNYSPNTVSKYRSSLARVIRDIGDLNVEQMEVRDFVRLKRIMIQRGAVGAGISTAVFSIRTFLNYCNQFLGIKTLDPKQIRPPKRIKREVIFLTKEEIEKFVGVIEIHNLRGVRFRALVEVILGTGMRISEVLSLKRKDIDWEKKEAKIIGKGNKERMVFFTSRALHWIDQYLERRHDSHESIFVTTGDPKPLKRDDIWRFFARYREKAKIDKPLTNYISVKHLGYPQAKVLFLLSSKGFPLFQTA